MTAATAPAWPNAVWSTPVLRGLDPPSHTALARAGRLIERAADATIYREGDASDSFFVVIAGAVELCAIRRGDDSASVLRVARVGDSFGEEALLPGILRRVTATASAPVVLAEIPIAVFRRITGRLEDPRAAQREQRYLERAAARDLLACSAFARDLGPDDVDLLLDGARLERFERGARIYEPGAAADQLYFVVEGLVQLQREDDGAPAVTAYLARGDFFGDQETLAGAPRRGAAVAAGDTWCAIVRRDVVRTLTDRNPGLLPRLRRVAETQEAVHAEVVGAAAARSTQHVFRDLYRMQMARSLLVIDQDSCVRCGHCSWACSEVHGVSRLIRRGDKVVTRLRLVDDATTGAASLLLPNTCQQCRHAACMIDCPTGAIGRDPEGEVFIRPELCTGCGNCAKACPWDNIQMAPRPIVAVQVRVPTLTLSAEIAVKCDLCHGYEAPACVEACPTGAVLRLDPARDIAEVALVLGATGTASPARLTGTSPLAALAGPLAAAASIALAAAGWALHRARGWTPGHGAGLAAGVATGAVVAALAAYVIPKRRIRARMRRRPPAARLIIDPARPAPRSRTRRHLIAHLGLGAAVPALALAHAGVRFSASPGGALTAALAVTVAIGVLAALAYRFVPRALTRLERRGTLPEDLAAERDALEARLYAAVTGKNDRHKALADRILLPYARAPLGATALVASGRSLADEERRLRRHIDAALAGRGKASLDGLDELIRVAVELRALPARRALDRALRIWPPLHVITGAMAAALLVVHVITAVLR